MYELVETEGNILVHYYEQKYRRDRVKRARRELSDSPLALTNSQLVDSHSCHSRDSCCKGFRSSHMLRRYMYTIYNRIWMGVSVNCTESARKNDVKDGSKDSYFIYNRLHSTNTNV